LGQAYAWTLGVLPYPDPSKVTIMLQDIQRVVAANESTGLLTRSGDARRHKTRVVGDRLEGLGFDTTISELRFSAATRPEGADGHPTILLAGFDDRRARRELEEGGFAHIVDAGLGTGFHYLDMLLHTFPGATPAATTFPDRLQPAALLPANFE